MTKHKYLHHLLSGVLIAMFGAHILSSNAQNQARTLADTCNDLIRNQTDNQVNLKISNKRDDQNIDIERGEGENTSKNVKNNITYNYQSTGSKLIQVTINDTNGKKTCEKAFTIVDIKGCTDPYASNYNMNATIATKNCSYKNSTLTNCGLIKFRSDKKNYQKNELAKLIWENDNDIKSYRIITENNTSFNEPSNPFVYRYQTVGKKNAKLIITTSDGLTTACQTNFLIGKLGCTYPLADNFDPTAEINDGSCISNALDPIIQILTKTPYQPGDKQIKIQTQYNGDHKRIEVVAILSANGKTTNSYRAKLQEDGSFVIPVSYQKGQLGYIPNDTYTLAVQIKHYKNNKKDQKSYQIDIRPKEQKQTIRCGNNKKEKGEECDGGKRCKECTVQNLSIEQKKLIQKIVKNWINTKKVFEYDSQKRSELIKMIKNRTANNEKILYAKHIVSTTIQNIKNQ